MDDESQQRESMHKWTTAQGLRDLWQLAAMGGFGGIHVTDLISIYEIWRTRQSTLCDIMMMDALLPM
eukprot:3636336-Amphidinium_carterae.1